MNFSYLRSLLATALVLAGLSFTQSARAQEVQVTGPLAGAPAVRNMRLYRQGRFLLEPNFSFGLQAEFKRPLMAGAHLGYYFTDYLGLGVWGAFSVANLNTGLTDEIQEGGVTTSRNRLSLPSRADFDEQVGTIDWAAAVQLEFSPLRGKLSIFEKLFIDTDLYIFAGVALAGVEERSDVNGLECDGTNFDVGSGSCDTGFNGSQLARSSRVAIAPTFGVGFSMYFNNFVGLNLNWRAMPFSWNASGWDDSNSEDGVDFGDGQINSDDRFLQLNHLFTL
ncbi:MAG: hypothetical protein AAF368_03495, partial [Planctomycetota bacterium]